MAISAGDGLEAAPGATTATAPAVIVRSAGGAGVPNVTVAFSVDSGGGSIPTTTATTNASGIASPGTWTLGPSEGPQVLLATVTGLTPLKIRASARTPTVQIGTGTVSTGGGTVTVTAPGSLLNGTTLSLPAGAVAGSAPVTLSSASTVGLVLKQGITVIAPALEITWTGGALTHPATIRIPTATAPDERTVLLAHNRRTGQSVPIPHQVAGPTGITALLSALDASGVPQPDGAAPAAVASPWSRLFGSFQVDDPLTLLITKVPAEALTRDYVPLFEIGRDFWDFTNFAVAWLPFLPGASDGSPVDRVIDIGTGMVATSLWYFKTQRGVPLSKRFRLQPDQPASNKVGIRWAALASQHVDPFNAIAIGDLNDLFEDETAVDFHWASLVTLKQSFYLGDDRPVPILLYPTATLAELDNMADPDIRIAIATGISGDEIQIIVPENSDFTYKLKVTRAGGVTPLTILELAGESYTIRSFVPVLTRPLLDLPAVASNWPKVLDGTVGEAEGWPVPELHWKSGKLDVERVFVADPLLQFWECPSCPDFGIEIPGAPETAVKPQGFQVGKIVGGAMAQLPQRVARSSITWTPDSISSDVEPGKTGHVIYLAQAQEGNQFVAGWLDWQTVSYRKISLHPSPAAITYSQDTTVNFTLDPSQPFPAGTTFSWVLRTEAGRDSVATTTPIHSRDLKGNGKPGKLLIIAHEKDTKRPIARDSVTIELANAAPFWRLTTVVDEDLLIDPEEPDDGLPFYDLIKRIIAAPQSGLIAIEEEAGGKIVLRLRVLPAATWSLTNCCPPTLAPLPGELRQSLGEQPTVTYPVGPYFSGYGVTQWSQSTTDLGAGTITGRFVEGGTESRKIKDLGTQLAPKDLIGISAIRNGTTMTGTISVYAWFQSEETDEISEQAPTIFRVTFTAERLR